MDEKGDLDRDSHGILGGWRKHFSQLLTVYRVSDLRRTDRHTSAPLVAEPSVFEVQMAIEQLKNTRNIMY
jgi:hypothetical protein